MCNNFQGKDKSYGRSSRGVTLHVEINDFKLQNFLENTALFITDVTLSLKNQTRSISIGSIQKQPPEVFYKKVFLRISQNSQESNCDRTFSFIYNETLAQRFSCAL